MGSKDIEVALRVSLPSVYRVTGDWDFLTVKRLMNGRILNFPLPCPPVMVSGLGKQIAISSLPQISYLSLSLGGVPRMALLAKHWPILKT